MNRYLYLAGALSVFSAGGILLLLAYWEPNTEVIYQSLVPMIALNYILVTSLASLGWFFIGELIAGKPAGFQQWWRALRCGNWLGLLWGITLGLKYFRLFDWLEFGVLVLLAVVAEYLCRVGEKD